MNLPDEIKPGPLEALGLWKAWRYVRRVKEILMADLVKQQSALPNRKVIAAGGGGTVAILIAMAAERFLGWQLSAEEAMALATACAVIVGYFAKERAPTGALK